MFPPRAAIAVDCGEIVDRSFLAVKKKEGKRSTTLVSFYGDSAWHVDLLL